MSVAAFENLTHVHISTHFVLTLTFIAEAIFDIACNPLLSLPSYCPLSFFSSVFHSSHVIVSFPLYLTSLHQVFPI